MAEDWFCWSTSPESPWCVLPPPGGPIGIELRTDRDRVSPISNRLSPTHKAATSALEIIGTAQKSKLSLSFAGAASPPKCRASIRNRCGKSRVSKVTACVDQQ